jgi:hypothetical protein
MFRHFTKASSVIVGKQKFSTFSIFLSSFANDRTRKTYLKRKEEKICTTATNRYDVHYSPIRILIFFYDSIFWVLNVKMREREQKCVSGIFEKEKLMCLFAAVWVCFISILIYTYSIHSYEALKVKLMCMQFLLMKKNELNSKNDEIIMKKFINLYYKLNVFGTKQNCFQFIYKHLLWVSE